MGIRYRLLLIVGSVTTIVFIATFLLESTFFRKNLQHAREETQVLYWKLIEEKRIGLENFISIGLAEQLAQVNALLDTISKFSPLSAWFAPTPENKLMGSWHNATLLLQNDDWIQFLQNTADREVLSLIVPEEGPFLGMQTALIDEGLVWVAVEGYEKPFLGIELPLQSVNNQIEETSSLLMAGILPTVYVLYDFTVFCDLNFSLEKISTKKNWPRMPYVQGYELDGDLFVALLEKAAMMASEGLLTQPELIYQPVLQKGPSDQHLFDQYVSEYLSSVIEYSSELFLLWEATTLHQLQVFGQTMQDPRWPAAISFSGVNPREGKVFFLKPIFGYQTPLFDDETFFKNNPPHEGSKVSSGAAVIKSPHENQAFFVNTAAIYDVNGHRSLLTIGFDIAILLSQIVESINQYGCAISGNQLLSIVSPQSKQAPPVEVFELLTQTKLEGLTGKVELGGTNYFFFKIQPDERLDFFFVILNPLEEELALYKSSQDKIALILDKISTQRIALELLGIIVLWVLLLDLSKQITRPIIALSKALSHVQKGQWDLIDIPNAQNQKNNEIKQLCSSFEEMVKEMKDKEKMQGILNKVVSKEIAKEILKGEIKLGGEERVATILFTDIRGFTKITQNMAPHEVIDLLNHCMTKLSQAVDDNKGVIDKYLGDGIMALYGAPIAYPDSALCAILTGLEMLRILQEWNEERATMGKITLSIGIGIHTGSVCAGNMGAQNRLNYTVIGSTVNLASRLCYAAEPGQMLITEETYHDPKVIACVEVEDKGMMSFKGFDEKRKVYRVIRIIQ